MIQQVITVKDSTLLNFELIQSIYLSISASDMLNDTVPPARATCIINLTEVNEKPLLVESKYYAFVNESAGEPIGTIYIQDEDKGQTYSYSITEQSVENILNINSTTGELTISDNSLLNSHLSETITFTVKVTDNGSPNLLDEKQYTLNILDAPKLISSLKVNGYKNNIKVFPNPGNDFITVAIPKLPFKPMIKIYDTRGIEVYEKEIISNSTEINTSLLESGIYYLQVIADGEIIGSQIIQIIR